MKKTAIVLLVACLSIALPVSGLAEPPAHAGKRHDNSGKNSAKQNAPTRSQPNKGSVDGVDLIHATITALAAREIALNSGFGGYQALPPGIAKNLARGKALPPGIAKKTVPGAMLRQLPNYPGYEWYVAGRDLILVNLAGLVIADVLHDVFK